MPSHRIRAAVLALAVPTLLALSAAPASAHNELESSTPVTGAALAALPGSVVLTFAEKPDPRFVKVAATGPGGTNVVAGPPRVSGASVTQPLVPGGAGLYTVVYRVVSADGHPVQGSITFAAADPARTADPADGNGPSPAASSPADPDPSTTPAAASKPLTSDDQGWAGYAIAGAVALALFGAALVLVRRRSRPEA